MSKDVLDSPRFLYRRCRDGSITTVVRRNPQTLVHSGNLVMFQPQLPQLEAQEDPIASRQKSRDLKFVYPYHKVKRVEAEKERRGERRKDEKQRVIPASLSSLRARNENIVEQLELSRNHHDLVIRRRGTRNPPIMLKPFSFSVQRVEPLPPGKGQSLREMREKRRTQEFNNHGEALCDLGFDDENRQMSLKLQHLLSTYSTPRLDCSQADSSFPTPLSQLKKPLLSPSPNPLPDEISQFLHEEFRQKLEKGYLSQMRFTKQLSRKPLALQSFRGLELL